MRQLNNKHYDTLEGASAHQGEIVSSQFAPSCQKDEKMIHTIISLSSDNTHKGTIDELVDFVNNHNDCRADGFAFKIPNHSRFHHYCNFNLKLEQLGYTFDNCGRAIKGGK